LFQKILEDFLQKDRESLTCVMLRKWNMMEFRLKVSQSPQKPCPWQGERLILASLAIAKHRVEE